MCLLNDECWLVANIFVFVIAAAAGIGLRVYSNISPPLPPPNLEQYALVTFLQLQFISSLLTLLENTNTLEAKQAHSHTGTRVHSLSKFLFYILCARCSGYAASANDHRFFTNIGIGIDRRDALRNELFVVAAASMLRPLNITWYVCTLASSRALDCVCL